MPSQANQFCSVLFEPSQISSPTDEMQTLTAALLPSSEARGIYIAYIKIVFSERSEPLCAVEIPLFLLHVWKRLPPFVVLLCGEAALLSSSRSVRFVFDKSPRLPKPPVRRPPPRPVDNIAHKKARNVVKHSNARLV